MDAQFYVALFEDSTLTHRVSDVKTLRFTGSGASTSVTFENLGAGTYYVAETNAAGTPADGGVFSGGVYYASYANGRQATIADTQGNVAFSFENMFSELPDPQHYKNVKMLTITKKVTDSDGAPVDSDEVFYAGIFADAGYTQLADHVSQNIVALQMNGSASASVTIEATVQSEGEMRLYVTEVNEKGLPVENSGSFDYQVSVVGGLVSLNIDSGSPSVTITNTELEPETEPESSVPADESEGTDSGTGGSGGPDGGAEAAKTSDETPIGRMLMLMLLSAAVLVSAGRQRRKRNA